MAKKELAVINLDQFSIQQLPELQNKKEEVAEKLSAFKYVEITDNTSYEEAKKTRTGVRTLRTDLQKEQNAVDKKIKDFILGPVKDAYEGIINEVLPVENKQQEEVTRWEDIKKQERLEKQRIEKERVNNIKNHISEFEKTAYLIIESSTIENVNENKLTLDKMVNSEFDFQEFLVEFEQAKVRVQYRWDSKCGEIQEKENQRLENERLAKEKAEADEKLRKIQEQQEKERLEREEKAKQEQLQMFEIRKNRLAEIGMPFNGGIVFQHLEFTNIVIDSAKVMSCNMIEFENLIAEAKEMIKKELEASKEVEEIIPEATLKAITSDNKNISEVKENLHKELEAFATEIVETFAFKDGSLEVEKGSDLHKALQSKNIEETAPIIYPAFGDQSETILQDIAEEPKVAEIVSSNTDVIQEVEFEETWDSIQEDYRSKWTDYVSLFKYLKENYNVPTKK